MFTPVLRMTLGTWRTETSTLLSPRIYCKGHFRSVLYSVVQYATELCIQFCILYFWSLLYSVVQYTTEVCCTTLYITLLKCTVQCCTSQYWRLLYSLQYTRNSVIQHWITLQFPAEQNTIILPPCLWQETCFPPARIQHHGPDTRH